MDRNNSTDGSNEITGLTPDEIQIIQEYRKLPGWGTLEVSKKDHKLRMIKNTTENIYNQQPVNRKG